MLRRLNVNGRWALAVIFAVALCLRLYIAWSTARVPTADDTGFRDTARAIAAGEGHTLGGRLTFKAPLYPMLMAAVYRAGGNDRAVRIAQAILGASVCLLVAWVGTLLVDRRSALIGAAVLAVHPIFLGLTERLLAENLFVWLFIAALGCAASLFISPSVRVAALLGAVCGLVALTRTAGIGLAVLVAAVFVIRGGQELPRGRRWSLALVTLVACGLVITPWAVRNWIRLHAFIPVSTELGRNLYSGWVSVPEERRFGFIPTDANMLYADSIESEVDRDRFLLRKAVEYVETRPDLIPRYAVLKTMYFWSPIDWDLMGYGEGVYNGVYVALLPFVLLGLWVARTRAPLALLVIVPVGLYFWGLAIIASGIPRYRYPLDAVLLVPAGLGLVVFLAEGKNRARRVAVAIPWLAGNVVAIGFSSQMKAAIRGVATYLGVW